MGASPSAFRNFPPASILPPTSLQELHDAVHVHKWHDPGFLNQYGAYMRLDIAKVIRQNVLGKVGKGKVGTVSRYISTSCPWLGLAGIVGEGILF